jgi:predicted DCC family thiol-disulfide oxidoreductase YuxK
VARAVAALDRRHELAFLGFGDPRAADLLTVLPEEERHATWRLAHPDGRIVGYGQGLVDLARALRPTRPLAPLLERIPARALDAAYRLIARNRPRLGRLVPNRPGPTRYP